MNFKNKKLNKLVLSSMLASTFVLTPVVSADDVDGYSSTIESIDQEISNLESQAQEAQAELDSLTKSIQENETKLAESEALIQEAEAELTVLNEEIAELEQNIEDRQEQIDEQARAVQTDGNPNNYITFVMEAESITDAFNRVTLVNDMIDANNSLVDEQKSDKEAVEVKRAAAEESLATYETTFAELESTSEELNEQKLQQEVLQSEIALAKADKESERASVQTRLDNAIAAQEAYEAEQVAVAQINETAVASVVSATSNTTATGSSNASTNNSSSNSNSSQSSNNSTNSSSSQSSNKTTTTTAPTGGGVAAAASIAHNYLGVPYVYGGSTPSGFDCSGLVQYVYAQAGISLSGRTAAAQSAVGYEVGLSGAQPGDIVYWGGAGSAYHTGIYIGNGQYIHAPKPGDVVKIGSVKWYTPTGARRVN